MKKNIALLFGGKSAEHEISILSAKNVFSNLDKVIYNPVLIKITKEGKWLTESKMIEDMDFTGTDPIDFKGTDEISLCPGAENPFSMKNTPQIFHIDAIFPVLHGPNGEDGSVQGMLKLLGVPFVGPSILGSAVSMDKEVMKRILLQAGIKIGKYLAFKHGEIPDFNYVKSCLGLPIYVKPSNMGSSIGISKVTEFEQFENALNLAYKYDTKIVIEENIVGKEIECAVLGNEDPTSSIPGEIKALNGFYDYESKYLDENAYKISIPAMIDPMLYDEIRKIAVQVFKVLECEGLSRVDVFLTERNEIIVNEINTLPGFTAISMYPMLWKESGIEYKELITKLINLAISRKEREDKLIVEK